MIELYPCPFCGHAARLWANSNGVFVRCTNQNCEVQTPLKEDTFIHDNWVDTRSMAAVDKAVKVWNRRTNNG